MKKKVLILDGDTHAGMLLKETLLRYDHELDICGPLTTCEEARTELLANGDFNLILSSPSLPGGDLLEVFQRVSPSCFVIFTSIQDRQGSTVTENLRQCHMTGIVSGSNLMDRLDGLRQASQRLLGTEGAEEGTPVYKKQLFVRTRKDTVSLDVQNILYFCRQSDYIFVKDIQGNKFLILNSIKNLQRALSSDIFYRINRQYLVNRCAIERVKRNGNSRMQVILKDNSEDAIFVSRNRQRMFMAWIEE